MKNYREVVIGPYSAYQIAVKHGFEGTEEDWLKSVERDRLAAEAAAEKAKKSNCGRYDAHYFRRSGGR